MRLELRNIVKKFGENQILYDVSLQLKAGEVLGLIGPNGSGKSTLMNILAGVYQQDSGQIVVDGQELDNSSPAAALKRGVFMLYQKPAVAPNMSVMENIFLGRYPRKFGIVLDIETMKRRTQELLKLTGCDFSPNTLVRDLSYAEKCMVTVLRAYLVSAKIMIIDETTAGLAREEQLAVFNLVRQVKSLGISVIYITHRMEELQEICDNICVLRDGRIIANIPTSKITNKIIWKLMEVPESGVPHTQHIDEFKKPVLQVAHLSRPPVYRDISFALYKGEILGIEGLVGSGRTDILMTIAGEKEICEGEMYFCGERFFPKSIPDSMKHGIAYMPDDRFDSGIVGEMTVVENVFLSQTKKKNHSFFLIDPKEDLEAYIEQVVKPGYSLTNPTKKISHASGGEQQKIVLLKTLFSNSKVLLLDEPTKGVDIATKVEIYDLIREKAEQGISFIVSSSDRKELEYLCDKVIRLQYEKKKSS